LCVLCICPTGVETDSHAPFPSKTLFFSPLSESTVSERKGALHAWLYALLEKHSSNKAVQMFLRDDGTGRELALRPLLEDFLPAGTYVTVKGLVGAAQHNGKNGRVMGFDVKKQRYVVRLQSAAGAEAGARPPSLSVQARNLEPAAAAAAAAAAGGEEHAMVWRIGNLFSLLGMLYGGAAVGSEAFECEGERWCLRLALMPSSELGLIEKKEGGSGGAAGAEGGGLLDQLEAWGEADGEQEVKPKGAQQKRKKAAAAKKKRAAAAAAGAGEQQAAAEDQAGEEEEDEEEEEEEEEEERLWVVGSLKYLGDHRDIKGAYSLALESADGTVIERSTSSGDCTFALPSRDNYSIKEGFEDGGGGGGGSSAGRVIFGTIDGCAGVLCDVIEAEGDNTLRCKLSFDWISKPDGKSILSYQIFAVNWTGLADRRCCCLMRQPAKRRIRSSSSGASAAAAAMGDS
jgi:hypothetical protein